jgi:arylsulfatase A-like enzyme
MNRREFLKTSAAFAGAVTLAVNAQNPADAPARKKNILILHTDQQRYDSLGCTGNGHAGTPNIDALAAEGTLFTRHVTTNPVCMPSRASLLTGLYPCAHGVWDNGVMLSRYEYAKYNGFRREEAHHGRFAQPATLADVCAQAGYQTACFGKMHLTPFWADASWQTPESMFLWSQEGEKMGRWHGPYYGFEYADLAFTHGQVAQGHYTQWLKGEHPEVFERAKQGQRDEVIPGLRDLAPAEVPLELHPSTWLGERFLRYLDKEAAEDKPFMAMVGFPDPHHPWEPTAEALERFADSEVLPPGDPENTGLPGYTGFRMGDWSEEQKRLVRQYTLAMVWQIDRAVGRIVDGLKERGLWEDTLIVFTSDHGDFLGDHGLLRKGPGAAHSLLHVPCIVRAGWRDSAPRRVDTVMSNTDVMPSVLAEAGVEAGEGVQGRDIFEVGPGEHRAFVESCRSEAASINYSVYDDRYRYTVYPGTGHEELFDHEADEAETTNLAGRETDRCRGMRGLIKDHLFSRRQPITGRIGPW